MNVSILEQSILFSGLSEKEIRSVLGCLNAREESFRKGETILSQGDEVRAVGLLLQGLGSIEREDFWGNRNLMARITPSQIFAEAFACSPNAVSAVRVLAESACTVLWLDVRRVLTTCPTACEHHSRIIRNLLTEMAQKNLLANEKLIHMGQRSTRDKLLSYLSTEAQRRRSPTFAIPFSRQELADYLGVERSAMSAVLGELQRQGLLTAERRKFTLHSGGVQAP